MAGSVPDQSQTPEVKHVYQHPSIDSLRWNFLTFREDDIVIATSGKTGTTWTQGIVANLIFLGRDLPGSLSRCHPGSKCGWSHLSTF
jgi:aryl sulfotransferase